MNNVMKLTSNGLANFITFTNGIYITTLSVLMITENVNIYLFAIGIWVSAFLDAIDGKTARKYSFDLSEDQKAFGRNMDSFVDLVTYFFAPGILLYLSGFDSIWFLQWILCFMIGIIRLSRFNIVGIAQKSNGDLFYKGMPVFWGLKFVTFYLLLSNFINRHTLNISFSFIFIIYSWQMIGQRPFFKYKSLLQIVAVIFFHIGIVIMAYLTGN